MRASFSRSPSPTTRLKTSRRYLLPTSKASSTSHRERLSRCLRRSLAEASLRITAALVANPIAGITASVPMITKGGLEAVTRSLATEYAKEKIRFNAVAPGVVDTPLHKDNPKDFLKTLSPMGTISDVKDIAEAVVYLTEARQVTGEVLHVDGGAHSGKW